MNSATGNVTRSACFRSFALLCALAVLWASVITHSGAQVKNLPSISADRAELHQALLDLTNPATVMCIAAHPDDEDGTTLTVLRRKYGVHTVSLFSTYGEGGQNAVGAELYEELGVIRARETIEASRIQGSEPHFLALKDFGFSKSSAETFRLWGHDEALRRMVLKIRELRPDVVITNHDTTTGHGHHQATGRLALEAFDAAADPKRFVEQLSSAGIWQVKRLFVRARPPAGSSNLVTGKGEAVERFVTVDPNERDPIRGTIYAEQALSALQKHASQGPFPKSIAERLQGNPSGKLPLIYYRITREAGGVPAVPADAKTLLDGLNLEQSIPPSLNPPKIEGRQLTDLIEQPDRVLNALINWRRRTGPVSRTGEESQRLQLIAERVDRALAVASGVSASLSSPETFLVRGEPTSFAISLANAGNRAVQINKVSLAAGKEKVPLEAAEVLSADTETIVPANLVTPITAPITVPPANHLYDGRLFGERFVGEANLEIDGAKFSVSAEKNLDVVPAVEIKNISPSPCVRTQQTLDRCNSFQVTLTNHSAKPFNGQIKTAVTPFRSKQARETIREIALASHETRRETVVHANSRPAREAVVELRRRALVKLSIAPAGSSQPISERPVGVTYADARVANNLHVGYLPSFDQTLEQSLAALGVVATELSVANIQNNELSRYDAVIIDNRGYYAHPELIAANSNLLNYVKEGGTLIIFYHKDNEWNPNPDRGRPQLAPYPIILGDERVTEEDAPISFIQPRHRLLNYPNRIRRTDFNNWIQERGLNYPKEWDPQYDALFSSGDKGEKPLRGGLLIARYGRGNYIYTSMVWYRQLRAGVPGAYRLLANMISYGKERVVGADLRVRPKLRRQRERGRPQRDAPTTDLE